MRRRHAPDDFEDDPDDSDTDDGLESSETVECPHCGQDVYESAERCPACGNYLSREDAPRASHPKWVVLTATILLLATLYAWLRWGM